MPFLLLNSAAALSVDVQCRLAGGLAAGLGGSVGAGGLPAGAAHLAQLGRFYLGRGGLRRLGCGGLNFNCRFGRIWRLLRFSCVARAGLAG